MTGKDQMKKQLTILLAIWLFFGFTPSTAQAQDPNEPLIPDMAQEAIDLLAIECQNINDFASVSPDVAVIYADFYRTALQKAIINTEVLLGETGAPYIDRLEVLPEQFSAEPDVLKTIYNECIAVRRDIQTKAFAQRNGQPARANVYDFASCQAAGYFVSADVCFMDGNLAVDPEGYISGRYNADCYDINDNYYPASCWFCLYGNNEEGCNPYH